MEDKTSNPEENKEIEENEAPTMIGGLKGLGFGLLFLGVAYYFYITMTGYENGESIRMNRLLLLAYGILGKNITVGILTLLGLFLGYSGVDEIMKSRK